MLRKTAARAFGEGEPSAHPPPLAPQTSRDQAVAQLFTDLQEDLARSSREPPGADGTTDSQTLQLTPVRTLSRGLEFVLRGPSGQVRFLNPMNGVLLASVQRTPGPYALDRDDAESFEELITVHCQWGSSYQPIVKPHYRGARRSGFRYTSPAELAARYRALVGT